MKKIRIDCDYLYWEDKFYCSTKTKYPIAEPEKCEIITNYEGLKDFIKQNEDKYIFYLPFLMVDKIDKELKENEIN